MKNFFPLLLLLSCPVIQAQGLYFPPQVGSTWQTISPASLGWCQDKLDSVIAFAGAQNSKALLILKDGKMVVEQYYGTFTQDSAWYWASAGKTLTATLVGIAQQEGYLSITDTSSTYLGQGWTDAPQQKEALITIRHQLTMTTGLDDGVPDNHCTIDTCLVYKADAGTRWAYHNAAYTRLDGVIEAATGGTFSSYFNTRIRNKIGMTGLWVKSGYNNVFYSNPRAMARFGLLILNKGIWNQDTILKDTAYFRQMTTTSQNLNLSYGYLWWLNGKASSMVPGSQIVFPVPLAPGAPADMFSALGKNGQIINVVPSMGLVMVRMGPQGNDGADVPYQFNNRLWEKMMKVFCTTSTAPAQEPTLSLAPNPAHDILMINGLTQKTAIQVTDLAGRVLLQTNLSPDACQLPVGYLAPGLYWLRAGNAILAFERH